MLLDAAAVLQWFQDHARRFGIDPDNPSLRTWVLAAAECAVDVGTNPGGLFVYLLRNIAQGDFSKLADERYDRAKLRLRSCGNRDAEAETEPCLLGELTAYWTTVVAERRVDNHTI